MCDKYENNYLNCCMALSSKINNLKEFDNDAIVVYLMIFLYNWSHILIIMYCENCGAEVSDDSKFCKECGSPIPKPSKKEKIEKKHSPLNANKLSTEKIMKNKKIIVVLIVIFALLVVGFFILNQPSKIPCKTINFHDKYTIDVPINSTYRVENGVEYYESDIADVILFYTDEKPYDNVTKDELGLYHHDMVYENKSLQEGATTIGSMQYNAIHSEKVEIDGVHMFHDGNMYLLPVNYHDECFLIRSTDPHVVAQIKNSMTYPT